MHCNLHVMTALAIGPLARQIFPPEHWVQQ